MRTTGTKRAIRNALDRLGLHTTPKAVVHALAKLGVPVKEGLVRRVRIELLEETTGPGTPTFRGRSRRQASAARRDFQGGGATDDEPTWAFQ